MKNKNPIRALWSTGIIAALAASLCCITPVLALLAGLSGTAAIFSWMEPARPYLIGLSVLVLGFAWWQKVKPPSSKLQVCCEEEEKPSFWQSRNFLSLVTILAGMLLTFPYYAQVFYPEEKNSSEAVAQNASVTKAKYSIGGMTCDGCASHIEQELSQLPGIIQAQASYQDGSARVEFDEAHTNAQQIKGSIRAAGYTITDSTEPPNK